MSEKVLFVDDEPKILDGIRRQLRKEFDVTTAENGESGLDALHREGPFAVVVSDMRMPGLNGAQFLAKVREVAPQTVRMILSGQSDLDAAIAAVNDGNLFRFLTKPCEKDALVRNVQLGVDQYRLVEAERELLDKTLSGSIQVLTEVLGLAHPHAFGRATRLQEYMEVVAAELGVEEIWEFRLAALFSQIGCISLPNEVVSKVNDGKGLSSAETEMFKEHPRIAGQLLRNIPRLSRVAKIVERQAVAADPASIDRKPSEWDPVELGTQTLRAVSEFDRLLSKELSKARAVERMRSSTRPFPRVILEALAKIPVATSEMVPRSLNVVQLRVGMIFAEDVLAVSDVLLARKDQEVTETMISRLRNFLVGTGVKEPILVLVPA